MRVGESKEVDSPAVEIGGGRPGLPSKLVNVAFDIRVLDELDLGGVGECSSSVCQQPDGSQVLPPDGLGDHHSLESGAERNRDELCGFMLYLESVGVACAAAFQEHGTKLRKTLSLDLCQKRTRLNGLPLGVTASLEPKTDYAQIDIERPGDFHEPPLARLGADMNNAERYVSLNGNIQCVSPKLIVMQLERQTRAHLFARSIAHRPYDRSV